MNLAPDPATVVALHRSGHDALTSAIAADDTARWRQLVVGDWTATELARHLLAVVDRHHDELDRAEAGDTEPLYPHIQQAGRNELEILDRGRLDGPEAMEQFGERAATYTDRLEAIVRGDGTALRWDAPIGSPLGDATVADLRVGHRVEVVGDRRGNEVRPDRLVRLVALAGPVDAVSAGGLVVMGAP
ncbi:MAG: hypothetical protein AAFZ07_29450, partial [Actinomycetota bacterium]